MNTEIKEGQEGGAATPAAGTEVPKLDMDKLRAPSGAAAATPPATPPADKGTEGKGADAGKGAATPAEAKTAPIAQRAQEYLATRTGGKIKLPEGINDDNAFEAFEDAIWGSLDPRVRQFQDAIDRGMTPDDWVKNYRSVDQLIGLDDKSVLREKLRSEVGRSASRPEGWDDARIDAHLDRQSQKDPDDFALKAEQYRNQLRETKAKQDKDEAARGAARINPKDPAYRARLEQDVVASVERVISTSPRLYGLNLAAEGGKDMVAAAVKEMLMPDATGSNEMQRLLRSEDGVTRAALLLYMGKTGLIEKEMTRGKEAVKRNMVDLLDPTPPTNNGGAGGSLSTTIDMNALKAPSRLVEGKKA